MSADGFMLAPQREPVTFVPWTNPERATLRAAYLSGGAEAARKALPGRSTAAIYNQACHMALRSPRLRGKWRKPYPLDQNVDARIISAYSQPIRRGVLEKLAIECARPAHWIKRRAVALGMANPNRKDPPWSDAEIDILEEYTVRGASTIRKKLAAAGFTRTVTAIEVKRKRLKFHLREEREIAGLLSCNQVAAGLGLDRATVARWVRIGYIAAKARGTQRIDAQGGDEYEIRKPELRRFVASYPHLIDLRKVNPQWFIALGFGDAL